ncbi:MAG: two component transcriptional regulator, winged helix family [Pedosphaera sp.]|nr:two component transcriptional regulator, winged helix family [Pedosphaera sp.]
MVRKLLYVDDELESRFVVADYLRSLGYDIFTVERSNDALRVAGEVALDTIILDINLAGENGFELMSALVAKHPSVPIILYSGMQADDARVKGMLVHGAHQFVCKNDPMESLVLAIQKVLQSVSG